MIGPDAAWVVARMTDNQLFWNGTKQRLENESVCKLTAIIMTDFTVTVFVLVALKYPARIGFRGPTEQNSHIFLGTANF